MKFPLFLLERNQTLYENSVEINLTESGVHPCSIGDILSPEEMEEVGSLELSYGYTVGRPSLRQAVADWYPGAVADNVMIVHGSSEANLLAVLSLVSPGEEIIFITPNFMQLDGLARGLGMTIRQVPLTADSWQPDFDAISAAVTPRTRMITICDPNNPTGTILTDGSRRELAALAAERELWLLVDEIYRGSEIDGGAAATAFGLNPRVMISGGLSKSFSAAGLRLGWLVGSEEVIGQCHLRQDYTTIGTGTLVQYVAERAMRPAKRKELLQRGRGMLSEGREQVRAWLSRHNDWSWIEPKAGGMAFLAYNYTMPLEEFSVRLRQEESVFVCAGAWFGLEGHIRIGIGVDREKLAEGLQRIDLFLDRHRAELQPGGG